jgi:HlyD family secretion protein
MRKPLLLAVILVALTGLSAAAMYARRGGDLPTIATDVVSRGNVVTLVSATGTLEAVETVEVGSQVSGVVQNLYADFNSIVRKGQVLARLDPSLIQADISRAQATLQGAEADRERLKVMLADAETKQQRAQSLADRQLIPATDLETAVMDRKTAEAQLKAADAQVTQARAALSQSQVNLQKTVIASPIDGIVISRSVDVGQTVAASLQAPTLFTLAADLTHMQLKASIDESDLGNIREGQPVTFRVDAYPNQVFNGVVQQVRLNPVVEQNVVTYATMVSAPNPELKLKPGMTANLSVEVARRDNVLRVPSTALRFKPAANVLAALGGGASQGSTARAAAGSTVAKPVGTTGASRPAAANQGTVWVYENATLQAKTVKTGIADGTFTEIVEGPLDEGTPVATRATLPGSASTPTAPAQGSSNPLLGPQPRRF